MGFFYDLKIALFVARKTISKGSLSTSALLVFILGLAFFNLLFISGFLSGFSDGILKSMINSSTSHIIITPEEEPVRKSYIVNQEMIRKQIETIPGVIATTRHYILSGAVGYDKGNNGVVQFVSAPIIGINEVEEKKVMSISQNMVSGTFPDELRDDEVILGSNLSGGYEVILPIDLGGVKAGDKVHIRYANGIDKIYTVRGIFNVTLGYASNDAFISDKEAESVLASYNQASEIMVRVDLVSHTIKEYVEKIKVIAPTLKIDSYVNRLAAVGVLVKAFDSIALIVSIISIVVSAATVFVMVYINALSKQKQIGILKAIGIKERIIEMSYVIQSLFYSIIGIIFGSLFLFFVVIPYLRIHPIVMPFGKAYLVLTVKDFIVSVIFMLSSSLVAGYMPARMISKRDILKVIWG
jgi:ABC-type lipoprotein release transport system permease subunit